MIEWLAISAAFVAILSSFLWVRRRDTATAELADALAAQEALLFAVVVQLPPAERVAVLQFLRGFVSEVPDPAIKAMAERLEFSLSMLDDMRPETNLAREPDAQPPLRSSFREGRR